MPEANKSPNIIGRMTAAERLFGRYMRAPDGHPEAAPAADAVADPVADEVTALGGATVPPVEGDPVSDAAPAADAADPANPDANADPANAVADADAVQAQPYEGLVAPEGTTLEEADMALATPLMRSLGIEDGEAAQNFINGAAPVIAQITERVGERMSTQMAENRAEMIRGWGEELRADPEFGGARYEDSLAAAALARDTLFKPEFVAFLNESGLGNHPEFVWGMARYGRDNLREDSIHGLNQQPAPPKPGDNLYDPVYSPKS